MYRNAIPFSLLAFLSLFACSSHVSKREISGEEFIHVSKTNTSYFAFTDGSAYIPVGINMINPSSETHDRPDSAWVEIEQWMKKLSKNGGNYVRVWLSESFWDMEERAGKYDEEKVKRIDRFVALARKYKLRIKVTFEHFRSITLNENDQSWATKFAYHTSQGGPLDSIRQYLTSAAGQKLFLDKIDFYQRRYGSDNLFFGLELWNEMNAMKGPEDSIFFGWNKKMLAEVKQRFPKNLVMQSLGSFDGDYARPVYKKMMALPGNEVAQVHRYLDPGAKLQVCHAPMDIIASSAVEELLSYHTGKPVILAETGAVEPHHAGPSKYYARDTAGILLHDILFAPFFSGAAGPGMCWHWESYVHRNKLWYHFGRFNDAIKGIDPIAEGFIPSKAETDALRVYVLQGRQKTLLWLRDKSSNWESELEKGIPPKLLKGLLFNPFQLGIQGSWKTVEVYDPWKNAWSTGRSSGGGFVLPDFKRSLVIRLTSQ